MACKRSIISTALILAAAIILSGCIQPQSGPQVKEAAASEAWKPDGIVGANEYARSMHLRGLASSGYAGGDLEISWKNDAQFLYVGLNGSTQGWIALGFEPTVWMKDADIIMGYVQKGAATVLDENCTGNYGPHLNDTELGGTYDILESGGEESGNWTAIEFKRRMNTGDKLDKVLIPGQKVSIIWAMADRASEMVKHNVAKGEGFLTLEGAAQMAAVSGALTAKEEKGLLFIHEEEKAARDLYLSFYQSAPISIFPDIAQSEQSHMDSVQVLLNKYGLQKPGQEARGIFANQTLQEIYDRLLSAGKRSQGDALTAAATFEEISITDLEKYIASTDKEDIRTVYGGLLAGSQKHLRSYVNALQERGMQYSPQHLSQQEFNQIVKPR